MGRRSNKRLDVCLPVRIWGSDDNGKPFSQMVKTLDVSTHGAQLAGFTGKLHVGQTVGLQYRTEQARHRVAWIATGDSGLLLGVESLQPEKQIWGGDLPKTYVDDFVAQPRAQSRHYESRENERRRHNRFPVSGKAFVSNPGGSVEKPVRLGDISLEGCFLETEDPFPVGARLKVHMTVHASEIETFGIVRTSFPGTGMGVQFTLMSPPDATRLNSLIRRLEMVGRSVLSSAQEAWRG